MRIWLVSLLFLLSPQPAAAKPNSPSTASGHAVIAVIAADKDTTYAMAEAVRKVRDANNFSKDHVAIARIPASQLKDEDFQRVGFSRASLPVVALMTLSDSENLQGVWGNPPAIMRNVTDPAVAGQIILCRWAEYASVKLPPALQSVAQIFQPFRVFVLNTGKNSEAVQKTDQELARYKAAEKISDTDLPVLSVVFGEGILTAEDYTRLGFGADALPAVCLVKMSDCANPTTIVGDGLLRWSYSGSFAAREALRQWARLKGTTLKTIPSAEPFSAGPLSWVNPPVKLAPNQPLQFAYPAKNYRFGPEARVWLQEETRVLKADGTQVGGLGGQTNHRHEGQPDIAEVTLQSSVVAPAAAGKYVLEVTLRDKTNAAKVVLTLPFEI